jgi:hypothetical protein
MSPAATAGTGANSSFKRDQGLSSLQNRERLHVSAPLRKNRLYCPCKIKPRAISDQPEKIQCALLFGMLTFTPMPVFSPHKENVGNSSSHHPN